MKNPLWGNTRQAHEVPVGKVHMDSREISNGFDHLHLAKCVKLLSLFCLEIRYFHRTKVF